jgi:predicted dehydrogenase
MGRIHAQKLRERSDVQLSIVDPAHNMNDPVPDAPDFAIIATPTDGHARLALPLLERGVPCLVEKPLAANAHLARSMASFPHLSVGHVERFNPVFAPLKTCVPRFIQAERIAPFSSRSDDIDVIHDLMIHDIDLVLGFMPGTVTDVRAIGIGVVSGKADIVNARVEIALTDGTLGVAQLTASRVSRRRSRLWRVVEAGMYWTLDLDKAQIQRIPWGEQRLDAEPIEVVKTDAITAEHDAFLAAVRGARPYPCTGPEALAALELADRIRAALC